MKVLCSLLFVAVTILSSAQAADDGIASEGSIRELIVLTGVKQAVENARVQTEISVKAEFEKQFEGVERTAEQQTILTHIIDRILADVREEMRWDVIESETIRRYQQTFSQSEVDGTVLFYRSPAGQAMLAKLPMFVKLTGQDFQDHKKRIAAKLTQLAQEMREQVKASEKK